MAFFARLIGSIVQTLSGLLHFLMRSRRHGVVNSLDPTSTLNPPRFSLLDELLSSDAILEVIKHMPAATTVLLSRTSKSMHTVCCDQRTAVWCAASRRELLAQQAVPGDLPLADVSEEEWTLERLHLCENPPRFPRIYFRFASDMLDWRGHVRVARGETVAQLAALLSKHPRLRIRIHGYAQPQAPSVIGEALAQARATSVRQAVLLCLHQRPEWADEDPSLGVRQQPNSIDPWSDTRTRGTQLVGNRVQAIGRWYATPTNRNFDADEDSEEDSEAPEWHSPENVDESPETSADDGEFQSEDDGIKLRRAEFTLLGLAA